MRRNGSAALCRGKVALKVIAPSIAPPRGSTPGHRVVVGPGGASGGYWRELWRYRELWAFLAWRDVSVRYRQTVAGVAWAVVQPAASMLVLTFVFGRLARMPSPEGVPHAAMTFAGMLPWMLFAGIVSGCAQSLTSNARLVTKVWFPRLVLPLSSVGVAAIDFAVAFAAFGAMCALLGFAPTWRLALVPFVAAWAALAALSIGVWFAALNVRFRDFRYIVAFGLQFGLYLTPVGYQSLSVGENLRFAYHLNPMASVVECFRWSVLGEAVDVYTPGVAMSLAIVAVLLASGLRHFRRAEIAFADSI